MASPVELYSAADTKNEDAAEFRSAESLRAGLIARNPSAFDYAVQIEGPSVARLASRLLARQEEVDDIVQEVFVRAWQSLPRFRGESSIRTWLGGITVNVCRTAIRRQRLWRLFLGSQSNQASEPAHLEQDRLTDLEWLRIGLGRLKSTDREVLVLRWLEQRSLAEVAQIVGVRPKTIEVRLHRAKQRLTSILEELRG